MKATELSKILETLNAQAPKGVGVFSISKETRLAPQTVREYLAKYTDYFVQLPDEQSYQINCRGKFNGSVAEMVQHYEQKLASQKTNSHWLFYLLFTSALITLSAAFV